MELDEHHNVFGGVVNQNGLDLVPWVRNPCHISDYLVHAEVGLQLVNVLTAKFSLWIQDILEKNVLTVTDSEKFCWCCFWHKYDLIVFGFLVETCPWVNLTLVQEIDNELFVVIVDFLSWGAPGVEFEKLSLFYIICVVLIYRLLKFVGCQLISSNVTIILVVHVLWRVKINHIKLVKSILAYQHKQVVSVCDERIANGDFLPLVNKLDFLNEFGVKHVH